MNNMGLASRGIGVLFVGSYVEHDEITIDDAEFWYSDRRFILLWRAEFLEERNMKKTLLLLLMVCTVMTCIFAFAGCDTADENPAPIDTSDETEPATEPETEPATEPETEPATEPETEPETELETEPTPAVPLATEGKVCITYGDSITWYDGNAYNWGKEQGVTAVGYQQYMKEELGFARIENCGFSGWTMPQIMAQLRGRTVRSFWAKVHYVTIMSGANDERHGTPLGEIADKGSKFDTTTYIGALQSGVEHILKMNPDIVIVLFTPIKGWIYAPAGYGDANPQSEDGVITEKWADAVKEVAALYGLPVCDLYNESGIDYEIADREAYMNDPEPPVNTLYSLHPNTAGYELLSQAIIRTFKSLP